MWLYLRRNIFVKVRRSVSFQPTQTEVFTYQIACFFQTNVHCLSFANVVGELVVVVAGDDVAKAVAKYLDSSSSLSLCHEIDRSQLSKKWVSEKCKKSFRNSHRHLRGPLLYLRRHHVKCIMSENVYLKHFNCIQLKPNWPPRLNNNIIYITSRVICRALNMI